MADTERPQRDEDDVPNRADGVGRRDHGGMGVSSERDWQTPGLLMEVDSREEDAEREEPDGSDGEQPGHD